MTLCNTTQHMPSEISMLIQDFARPMTRWDWRKGSKCAEVLKNSEEFKEFEYYGYNWASYAVSTDSYHYVPIDNVKFDATFAYEWANQKWCDNLIKKINFLGGNVGPFTVDQHTRFCLDTGKMKWFWFCEPYYNFLEYDFNKKIWYNDA